jgi:cob(I)alamin adenosyltransferase
MTLLRGGRRAGKDNIRIETCGSLDEVASFLGLAKSLAKNSKTKNIASLIQKELIALNAEVVSGRNTAGELKKRIDKGSIAAIEKEIGRLEGKCGIKTRSFCLQGGNAVSASLDVARAISRRAERRCVTMAKKKMLKNRNILVYLNRLSDLLYLLARFNEK